MTMMVPNHVRLNMRYRGPMESVKVYRSQQDISANLTLLRKQMEALRQRLESYQTSVYEGKPYSVVEKSVPVRMEHVARQIDIIERGVRRG
jgi:hypothetical protein